ncbi:MAG: GNAT family acetyltransferase [Chloroflexi bacterium]|nr:GNAT family acetyltransferase [Chloroflexota bacterium]
MTALGAAAIDGFESSRDFEQVAALWREVFAYDSPHNAPALVIRKKLEQRDGLFFVARLGQSVVGTVMAGYDGHRGWIYSLAVLPDQRRSGIGSRLLRHAEARLAELGCIKVNLQIVAGNEAAVAFYERHGYQVEPRISMGKRLWRG